MLIPHCGVAISRVGFSIARPSRERLLPSMSESKLLRLLVTTGRNEEVLAVLVRECHPDLNGKVSPPQMVEHEGKQYVIGREWMPGVHVYVPSQRSAIDDFLGNEPL
jgi:hypothetical protein